MPFFKEKNRFLFNEKQRKERGKKKQKQNKPKEIRGFRAR